MTAGKRELVAFFILAVLVGTLLQYAWKAPTGEFWHTDDAHHYISGLMIREWMRAGFPSPLAFAYDFNAHYPLVGIGLWGPAFYLVEGIWQFVFGAGKGAALLLSASVAAAVATTIYALSVERGDRASAAFFALAFCLSPLGVEGIIAYGLDLPVALFALLSAIAFEAYLADERRQTIALFGILVLFCLFIKGNALALGLFVPLAIVLTGRFAVLRNPSLWLCGCAILALAVPWYLLTYRMPAAGFRHAWGIDFVLQALPANGRLLLASLGVGFALLLIVGVVRLLKRHDDMQGRVLLALIVAVFLFQSVVPASLNSRYLLPLLAPALVLCADGWRVVRDALARRTTQLRPAVLGAMPLLFLGTLPLLSYPQQRIEHGFADAARIIAAQPQAAGRSILIAAFGPGESAFIAEMAMARAGKADMYVIRGSRLLAGGGYNIADYSTDLVAPTEVSEGIAAYRIPLLVIANTGRASEWKHIALVDQMLKEETGRWQLLWRHTGSDDLRIYIDHAAMREPGEHHRILTLTRPRNKF